MSTDLKKKIYINLCNILPDHIYKNILQYIFLPKIHLMRYDDNIQKWNKDLFINKCCICNCSAKKKALAHMCDCCDDQYNNVFYTCHNQLICWDCAH